MTYGQSLTIVRQSLILVVVLSAAISTLGQEKIPVPSDEAQAKALELIKEVYGQEWKDAETSTQKQALATKLLQKSRESADDTNRYVLLKVARDVAAQAGDAELAFRAIDTMASRYDVDAYKLKGAALSQAANSATHSVAVARLSLELIDQAVEKDDFVAAKYLGSLALGAARKGRDGQLVKQVVARNKEVEEAAEAHAEIKDALLRLEDNPVDPDANLAVARYYCFVKANWNRGVPMLALSPDGKLKELAVKELRGVSSAEEQVALGDGWWKMASVSEGGVQKRLEKRADYWYRKALPQLTGLMKDRVEKRLVTTEENTHAEPPSTYLTNLEPLVVNVGEGVKGFRSSFNLGGKKRLHGFKAHPASNSTSIIVFNLHKAYRKLTGAAGIGDVVTREGKRPQRSETPLTFEILGDGRSLWKSRRIQIIGTSQNFVVNISGVKKLQLCVHCPGKFGYAWARWVDPVVSK